MVNYLEVEKLSMQVKDRKIVNDVSFRVQSGEIVGILGANGAGKTSVFDMIIGLYKCEQGTIRLNDADITKLPIHRRANLGLCYLPQESSIFTQLSTLENVLAMIQETKPKLTNQEQKALATQLLEEFQLMHVASTLGSALSGGERRRAEIARTLAVDPKFLLLDEPFAGVDPIAIAQLQDLVRDLAVKKHLGILITDHNVSAAMNICSTIYVMHMGKVIACGSRDEIIANSLVQQVYLGNLFN